MCTLGSPVNVQMILCLSPSVLQHHWCNSFTSCSYLATQLVHILHLHLVHHVLHVPPQKKSKGVKPGDQEGHAIGSPFPIHLSGNCCFRKAFTGLAQCGEALTRLLRGCIFQQDGAHSSPEVGTLEGFIYNT
jgi:hypothetical protein